MKEIEKLFVENPLTSDVVLQKIIDLGIEFLGGIWKTTDKDQVFVSKITGGQSNHMFHVATSTFSYLLRIHREGQSQFFTDIVNFAIFSERNLGPKLYGFFEEGRLEEFIPSKTLRPEDVLKPEISMKIAESFPRYHAIEVPVSRTRQCFQIMRESIGQYQELGGGDYDIFPTKVTYSDHPKTISIMELSREIDNFERWSHELFENTLVFCHNDLTCANILQLNSTNEIMFIDWEFATYNYRGFDIAMHLSETAVLRTISPSGIQINEKLTDNHPNLHLFCQTYVDSSNKLRNQSSSNRSLEVEHLMKECMFFWPVTHLFWACLIMKLGRMECNKGANMDIQACDRLAAYFHLKPRTEEIYNQLKK